MVCPLLPMYTNRGTLIVAEVADVTKFPLSRQTDLLRLQQQQSYNIKKGQFMAPDMKQVITNAESGKRPRFCMNARYHWLQQFGGDMRGLIEMRSYGYPVVFDATHLV